MRRFAYVPALLALMAAPAWADYYDGLRAFDKGEHGQAAKEWLVAARSGDARAQYRLGGLYEKGLSVPQSFVHAHLWYNRAAARGSADARKARDALAAKMTRLQLAKAQNLAVSKAPASVTVKRVRPKAQRQIDPPRSSRPPSAPQTGGRLQSSRSQPPPATVVAPTVRPWVKRASPQPRPRQYAATPPVQTAALTPRRSYDGSWRGIAVGDLGSICEGDFAIGITVAGNRASGYAQGQGQYCPLEGTVDGNGTAYLSGRCFLTSTDVKIEFGSSPVTGGFTGNIEDCWGSLALTRR